MNKTLFYFLMILIMVVFSLVFIALKIFADIDITLSQCMMPMWIGVPIISVIRFLFYIMYESEI